MFISVPGSFGGQIRSVTSMINEANGVLMLASLHLKVAIIY